MYSTKILNSFTNDATLGSITSAQDGIYICDGLESSFIGEIVNIKYKTGLFHQGFITDIKYQYVKVILMRENPIEIKSIDFVCKTKNAMKIKADFSVS